MYRIKKTIKETEKSKIILDIYDREILDSREVPVEVDTTEEKRLKKNIKFMSFLSNTCIVLLLLIILINVITLKIPTVTELFMSAFIVFIIKDMRTSMGIYKSKLYIIKNKKEYKKGEI